MLFESKNKASKSSHPSPFRIQHVPHRMDSVGAAEWLHHAGRHLQDAQDRKSVV